MEEFRKKMEKKLRIYSIMCCIMPSIFFGMRFIVGNASDFSQGMVTGLFIGGMFSAIFLLTRTYAILHNEEMLKSKYIQETDERNNAIIKQTTQTSSLISIFVTAMAVIITGFINEVICITLFVNFIVDVIITLIVLAYYKRKM